MAGEDEVTEQLDQGRREMTLDEYRTCLGREIGLSKWFEMSQERIDAFAAATEDATYIHTDHQRANATLGTTVAHGFLTLSMIGAMAIDALPEITGRTLALNYGFDKVRMITPVPSGSRIRGRFVLIDIVDRGPGEVLSRMGVTVEIEGHEKPALVADWFYHSRFS